MRTMKLLLAAGLLLAILPEEAIAFSNGTTTTFSPAAITASTAIGRKRKGYRPKRGGLFNMGLFRKKNACGCPNH